MFGLQMCYSIIGVHEWKVQLIVILLNIHNMIPKLVFFSDFLCFIVDQKLGLFFLQ
jgi:hypothetical protein